MYVVVALVRNHQKLVDPIFYTICHVLLFGGCGRQSIFDPIFVYTLLYTLLPVLALGMFDEDVYDENNIKYSKLFPPGHHNSLFDKGEFFMSAIHGCVTSCVVVLSTYGSFDFCLSFPSNEIPFFPDLIALLFYIGSFLQGWRLSTREPPARPPSDWKRRGNYPNDGCHRANCAGHRLLDPLQSIRHTGLLTFILCAQMFI